MIKYNAYCWMGMQFLIFCILCVFMVFACMVQTNRCTWIGYVRKQSRKQERLNDRRKNTCIVWMKVIAMKDINYFEHRWQTDSYKRWCWCLRVVSFTYWPIICGVEKISVACCHFCSLFLTLAFMNFWIAWNCKQDIFILVLMKH